jgi:glycosyltransferase-like protein
MKLSIGLFTYSTEPRGSVVHTAYLADALVRAGADVTVYALDKNGRGFFRPLLGKLVLVPASKPPPTTAELVRVRSGELAQFLLRESPKHDVFHAEDCLSTSGLLALRERGVRVDIVRTVHHVERFEDPYLDHCQRRSIMESSACFAVSRDTAADVARSFGVRAHLVSNGVDAARFEGVDPALVASWKRRLGLEGVQNGPVILGVGGVEERKNTVRLLRAFARVATSHVGARFVIVGGATVLDHGAYRARYDAAFARLPERVKDAVVETGIVSETDVAALFRLASVVALPSIHEGFGLAALEGLSASVPVLASRFPPFTEYLDDTCAELVDPYSEADITGGLARALRASPLRLAAGCKRAAEYSWDKSAQRHLELYLRHASLSRVAS